MSQEMSDYQKELLKQLHELGILYYAETIINMEDGQTIRLHITTPKTMNIDITYDVGSDLYNIKAYLLLEHGLKTKEVYNEKGIEVSNLREVIQEILGEEIPIIELQEVRKGTWVAPTPERQVKIAPEPEYTPRRRRIRSPAMLNPEGQSMKGSYETLVPHLERAKSHELSEFTQGESEEWICAFCGASNPQELKYCAACRQARREAKE